MICTPSIPDSTESPDFGCGFYLSPSFAQARRWANRLLYPSDGRVCISVFEPDREVWKDLSVYTFPSPEKNWLRMIAESRMNPYRPCTHDVICGFVPDFIGNEVIDRFIDGVVSEKTALENIRKRHMEYQIVLKTDKALSAVLYRNAFYI